MASLPPKSRASPNTGPKPFRCRVQSCCKNFTEKRDLSRHMRDLHKGYRMCAIKKCEFLIPPRDSTHLAEHLRPSSDHANAFNASSALNSPLITFSGNQASNNSMQALSNEVSIAPTSIATLTNLDGTTSHYDATGTMSGYYLTTSASSETVTSPNFWTNELPGMSAGEASTFPTMHTGQYSAAFTEVTADTWQDWAQNPLTEDHHLDDEQHYARDNVPRTAVGESHPGESLEDSTQTSKVSLERSYLDWKTSG